MFKYKTGLQGSRKSEKRNFISIEKQIIYTKLNIKIMQSSKTIYISLIIISASIVCFEILTTRVSSLIFVSNYAFIILSLAILGLGIGGVFSHYSLQQADTIKALKAVTRSIILAGASILIFIVAAAVLKNTNPIIYFICVILPFFFAGIIYSQFYKLYSSRSFLLYASDLLGAAIGAIGSIFVLNYLGAVNGILFDCFLIFCSLPVMLFSRVELLKRIVIILIPGILAVFIFINSFSDFIGKIPIGNFSEKDFYYVYPDAQNISIFEDSRWSVYGRADLIKYTNQDAVKQIFIDGSAGSQMYRFNGDVHNPGNLLFDLLLEHTTSIPFLLLPENQKSNMLVIGPGGGKEILIGLVDGVKKITGVEVNPDFVDLVKEQSDFNGGIYTNFPNVNIHVAEGRHFVKQSKEKYDLIVMALPSTEQLQNVNNLASNENYLITVEALKDYLNTLNENGCLVFTVHNRWELIRLIVTAFISFEEDGISNYNALNHFIVISQDYAPTIVIRKSAFSEEEIAGIKKIAEYLPANLPIITYLPYNWRSLNDNVENRLLSSINSDSTSLRKLIAEDKFDISPVRDDSPYFYKINRTIPDDFLKLFLSVVVLSFIIVFVPLVGIKDIKKNKAVRQKLIVPLIVFVGTGFGFMVLEMSLFQKLILYLGSPTVSLSVLLASILIGMGVGSYFGGKIFSNKPLNRLAIILLMIVIAGVVLLLSHRILLNELMSYGAVYCTVACFVLILPFGCLLGMPFPSAIQIMKANNMDRFIPWMYGVNGILTVLGSVTAVILSMTFGYNVTFLTGITAYFILFIVINQYRKKADLSI